MGADIEALRLNTAISQMMIFANAMQKEPRLRPRTMMAFLQLLAPFAPHIAEELWARLGGISPVHRAPWPTVAAGGAAAEQKLVIQVNGRHRGDVSVKAGLTEAEAVAEARRHPKVQPHLEGRAIRRVIYVPGKIVNLVVDQ